MTAKALLRGTAGQALVELALSLPILMLIMVGITDFGRYSYAAIEVSNAAHAGVQYGAQNHATASDTLGMQVAAIEDAANLTGMTATPSHFCACSDGTSSNCTAGSCTGSTRMIEFVQVNTAATINPIFQYTSTLTLNGQAILRVEQ
jgi:Flp pilus assembly protein TadG